MNKLWDLDERHKQNCCQWDVKTDHRSKVEVKVQGQIWYKENSDPLTNIHLSKRHSSWPKGQKF